ncbi:hypothetical protein BAX55_02710 [Acinetobacter baumannii]|uniref:TolC family protein n=1 Tax=Acinetobacter baumannii TaxID=470 RepID=UPI0007EE8F9B|nr:TolC family protein [Acinetobacter baumannii]OBS07520.1 hypothetical protein BAX55_02710 [Acinetobacter baumannii]TPS59932.1 TolC family protein [Acinetobacter baumannii]HAV3552982.1 TolC family protein [Acinetobacter baumannii]
MYKAIYIFIFFNLIISKVYAENFSILLDREKYDLIKKKYESSNYNCLKKIDAISKLVVDLNTVIDYTLCNNPDVSEAWLLAKKQIEQVDIIKSNYLPKVNLIGESNIGKVGYKAYANPQSNYNSKSIYSSVNIDSKWLFYDFGLKNNSIDQAKFMLIALSENQNAIVQKAFLEASTLYFEVIRLQGEFTLNQEAENLAQQSYSIAEKKYHAGIGLLSEMLQAKTNLAKASSDKIKAEGHLLAIKGELAVYMGFDVNSPLEINARSMSNPEYQQVFLSVNDLLQQANKIHPELLRAQAEVFAAKENVQVVKKGNLPKLSLTSSLRAYRQQGNPSIDIGGNETMAGIKEEIPIFSGFEYRHKLKMAQSDLDLKDMELQKIQRKININVWKSYYNLSAETENLNSIEELQNSALKFYQISIQRYKSGVGSMLELIDAQKSLADAKQQKNSAISKWNIARVELLASIGLLK